MKGPNSGLLHRLMNSFMTEVSYRIETSPLICRANQWTGYYMIGTSVMKELIWNILLIPWKPGKKVIYVIALIKNNATNFVNFFITIWHMWPKWQFTLKTRFTLNYNASATLIVIKQIFWPFKRQRHKMVKYTQTNFTLKLRRIVLVYLTILWGWRFKG